MDAYAAIKAEFGISRSTLNEWQEALEGLEQGDWLPALVPDLSGRTNARRADFGPAHPGYSSSRCQQRLAAWKLPITG